MKGLGTDEDTIIELLSQRSNSQRQQIKEAFASEYDRVKTASSFSSGIKLLIDFLSVWFIKDLIDDLKSELGGKCEDVIVGLMDPPEDYMCKQLHKAMEGMGTDEQSIVEIICSRNNREIHDLVKAYERRKYLILICETRVDYFHF
jgi:annexin A7/11